MQAVAVNPELVASQLLRALRGKRSQMAFSRRLKCQSNVLYTWESGRRFPSARLFFAAAAAAGVNVPNALAHFFRTRPCWLDQVTLDSVDWLVCFLGELKGQRALVDIARAADRSRFRIARWFAGQTEPRLPDLLRLVNVTSYRVLDFVASFVPPERVPAIASAWRTLEASRSAAYAAPWCHAVLRLLETERFASGKVDATRIASILGISLADAVSCLSLLVTSGQVQQHGARYVVTQVSNVDMAEDREGLRRLKRWAAEVGANRIQHDAEGIYSYNLFCVSEGDYIRLQQLQREYYRNLRAIVAESTPSQRVVMTNLQLFALD